MKISIIIFCTFALSSYALHKSTEKVIRSCADRYIPADIFATNNSTQPAIDFTHCLHAYGLTKQELLALLQQEPSAYLVEKALLYYQLAYHTRFLFRLQEKIWLHADNHSR